MTCKVSSFSKYCALQRYGFTFFGLKYEVSKFDFVISSKKFVPGSLSSNLVKEPVSKILTGNSIKHVVANIKCPLESWYLNQLVLSIDIRLIIETKVTRKEKFLFL